jgi:site-specific DNA recombinase|tara:strand:- start:1739 stop:3214 length:1476 start_codon:yes stop_codon:yes gene_type:complete
MTQESFVVDLYIRVSTDRQAKEGDSLEEQESELRKFCDYRNFKIHKVFIERGKSGGNTNRPEYKKLVKDIENGKINAVVVKKLDRLSRSLLDFEQLTVKLNAHDVGFISLRENFDTTTAMGKAMLRVALVFAQLEREQTAERIKDVFAWRAEQGLSNGGTRPFGYDSVSSELIPHKQERKVIEFIFKTFLELKSTTLVANECNAMGFKRRSGIFWDKREIHKTLKRPVYKGYIKWNDDLFKGIHQPLISEETFEKVQTIFNNRELKSPRNSIKGLLKNLFICGRCHNHMRPHYTKKKNGNIYRYYRCATTINNKVKSTLCAGQYVPIEAANQEVLNLIVSFSSEAELQKIQLKMDHHNTKINKEMTLIQAEMDKLQANLSTTKQKKEQYLDSLVTKNFSKEERQKINEKIDEFSLNEKQLDASIYRYQFDLADKDEKKVTIESFKEAVIKLKVNLNNMEEKDIQTWLKVQVKEVVFDNNDYEVRFKCLDFS